MITNSGKLVKWEEGVNRICDLDVARDRTKEVTEKEYQIYQMV